MSMPVSVAEEQAASEPAAWGAVFALALGAFVLVASEFMPVSLLTPIAADLGITEGQAGQAIAVSGAFAVLTSLSVSWWAGRLDRRLLLLGLTGLTILSGAVVAFAPNYLAFMAGRALLGVVIGGFWSMSAATVMRLVPAEGVTRALAILNGGNALATVVAAPLGSFLGGLIGWRGAFFCVVPAAVLLLAWQAASLPALAPLPGSGRQGIAALLRRPVVAIGMAAAGVFFMGQFALFTYLRPFLERAAGVNVNTLSLLLLAMGVAGFAGTAVIGAVLAQGLYRTLAVIPLLMAGIATVLPGMGGWLAAVAALLVAWGFLATAAPVGWWSWMSRTMPRDAEAGGGLMVAIIQLAITLGATLGGVLFDTGGAVWAFGASAIVLVLGAALVGMTARIDRAAPG